MASNTIMNRLANSFNSGVGGTLESKGNDKPKQLTRYFGGHNRQNHPFVSGYWQLYLNPPARIFQDGHNTAIEWFHSACEGFTPPSRTLNKADIPGQGGLGSSYVTGQTLTRNFSITFREYRDMPLMNLFERWTSIIDPYVGVSEVTGKEWMSSAYKGSAFVILTKPTGAQVGKPIQAEDIEEIYFFHGVWPENAPHDALATDISANDVVQYSLTFSFDGWPLTKAEEPVVSQALKVIGSYEYLKHTHDDYVSDVTKTTPAAAAGAGGLFDI